MRLAENGDEESDRWLYQARILQIDRGQVAIVLDKVFEAQHHVHVAGRKLNTVRQLLLRRLRLIFEDLVVADVQDTELFVIFEDFKKAAPGGWRQL